MTDTTPEAVEPDLFDDWLESGTVRHIDVELQNDPSVVDEYQALQKRRAELEGSPEADERSIGDTDPLTEIEAAEAALMDRWEAGKSTWTVRALTPDEAKAISRAHRDPEPPQMLPKAAPANAKAKWEKDRDAWREAAGETTLTRNLHFIAQAVVKIKTVKGERGSITVDQLRAMYQREYGPTRIEKLLVATNQATQGEVEMPRPKLRERSTSDPA